MLCDWLPVPDLGSFDGPGRWDPSLSPVHSPHCAPWECPATLPAAPSLCVLSCSARKCWIAAVWELLASGAVRQGENTGRENAGRRPSGPVG